MSDSCRTAVGLSDCRTVGRCRNVGFMSDLCRKVVSECRTGAQCVGSLSDVRQELHCAQGDPHHPRGEQPQVGAACRWGVRVCDEPPSTRLYTRCGATAFCSSTARRPMVYLRSSPPPERHIKRRESASASPQISTGVALLPLLRMSLRPAHCTDVRTIRGKGWEGVERLVVFVNSIQELWVPASLAI